MAIQAGVYTFLDVQCSINGYGGQFDIKSSGVSDEAIRISMVRDKNTMVLGANGDVMHSMNAARAAVITISLLKTGMGNAMMSQMYSTQEESGSTWANNAMVITNPVTGDTITATGGAFKKHADIGYATEGGLNTWAFDFAYVVQVLGNGLQNTGLS